jgi:hypothetical protein
MYYENFSVFDDGVEIVSKQAITTLLLDIVPSNPSVQYSVDVQLFGESVYLEWKCYRFATWNKFKRYDYRLCRVSNLHNYKWCFIF